MGGAKVPLYDEEDESPDPRSLDLSEVQTELENINERIADRKKQFFEEDKKKKQAVIDAQKALEAEKAAEAKEVAKWRKVFKKARNEPEED